MEKKIVENPNKYTFLEMLKLVFYLVGFLNVISSILLTLVFLSSGDIINLFPPFLYQLVKNGIYIVYCFYGIKASKIKKRKLFRNMTLFSIGIFLYRFFVILKFEEDKVFNIPIMFVFLAFLFYYYYLKSPNNNI